MEGGVINLEVDAIRRWWIAPENEQGDIPNKFPDCRRRVYIWKRGQNTH